MTVNPMEKNMNTRHILSLAAVFQALVIALGAFHMTALYNERDWLRQNYLAASGVATEKTVLAEAYSAIAVDYAVEIAALKRERLQPRIAAYVRSVNRNAPAEEIAAGVIAASDETGLDISWLLAKQQQESHFDPLAVSQTGCRGLVQMCMAASAEMGIAWNDNFKPRLNIMAGARYLKKQVDAYGGNIRASLIRYNGGDDNRFVERIERHRARILAIIY